MLEIVEDRANEIREVKIFSLSRLARKLETQVSNFARLKRAKVRLLSLTQSFADDPMGNMVRNIVAVFDEHFALETAKHVRRTMRQNAIDGFFNGGKVPSAMKAGPSRYAATSRRRSCSSTNPTPRSSDSSSSSRSAGKGKARWAPVRLPNGSTSVATASATRRRSTTRTSRASSGAATIRVTIST